MTGVSLERECAYAARLGGVSIALVHVHGRPLKLQGRAHTAGGLEMLLSSGLGQKRRA